MTEVVDLAELRRLTRSAREERRPLCPSCGTRAPYDAPTEWLRGWGHRCPHGEPCAAWSEPSLEHVTACVECAAWTGAASNETAKPEEGGGRMPHGTLHEYQGDQKTVADWARDPRNTSGLGDTALGMRLRSGWPMHDALTTPKGSPRPGGRRDKAASATPKRAAKRRAGEKLNALFDGAPASGPAKRNGTAKLPPRALAPAESADPVLAPLLAAIETRRREVRALMYSANLVARDARPPLPFPELVLEAGGTEA